MARLLVLVDNEPGAGLRSSWGLSILVERGDRRILFDADTEPDVLEYNVKALGVDLSTLDYAVLSHPHSDHYGGFEFVGRAARGLTVYVPRGSGRVAVLLRRWGLRPVENQESRMLEEGVYIVGPLKGWYAGTIMEQALLVRGGKGYTLLVGCSHPGVDRLAAAAYELVGEKLYMVIGGYHQPQPDVIDRLAGYTRLMCAIHCSGDEAREYIRREYPDAYCEARTGSQLEF